MHLEETRTVSLSSQMSCIQSTCNFLHPSKSSLSVSSRAEKLPRPFKIKLAFSVSIRDCSVKLNSLPSKSDKDWDRGLCFLALGWKPQAAVSSACATHLNDLHLHYLVPGLRNVLSPSSSTQTPFPSSVLGVHAGSDVVRRPFPSPLAYQQVLFQIQSYPRLPDLKPSG